MREIKFRAWDKDEGGYRDHENLMSHVYAKKGFDVFNDPDYIIEQYTGLRDKNGREIYEGDIVRTRGTKRAGEYVTEVIYAHQGFKLKTNKTVLVDGYSLIAVIEVIGNIHENPELLK